MATSQNGWPVHASQKGLVKVDLITGRLAPAAAPIFQDLVQYFDKNVENINPADSWGWAYRPIRGKSKGYSNHASGTAVDINATRHPMHKRKTFSAAQVAEIRKMLKRYTDPNTGRSIIRWGGDFKSYGDDMHFEIHKANQEAAKRVASHLGKRVASGDMPTLQQYPLKNRTVDYTYFMKAVKNSGYRSESMQGMQACLKHFGSYTGQVDGLWGPKTLAGFRAECVRRGWSTNFTVPSWKHCYYISKGLVKKFV